MDLIMDYKLRHYHAMPWQDKEIAVYD